MTNNKSLFRGILVEQFKLEIMATQRDKELPKTSDVLLFSLKVVIPETKNNTQDRGGMDSTVELKETVIHQLQITDHQ